MVVTRSYLLCLAYIMGLLLTGIQGERLGMPLGAIALMLCMATCIILVPQLWRTGPSPTFWIVAGLISSLAFVHLHLRTPHPGHTDLSRWQQRINPEATVTVHGKILNEPRLTRSQNVRFELETHDAFVTNNNNKTDDDHDRVQDTPKDSVTGNAYTTVKLLQGTGLYPGQWVEISGSLYLPNPAQNPGGFDFRAYLARRGIFSGLRGQHVTALSSSPPILWKMRQRIVQAIVRRLGTPEGPLLSAMVLGRRAVDLPHDLRDEFTQAGLSHTIAASGFHVSLLLGVVMALTQRFVPRTQCLIGTGVLLLYIGLTGAQASVIRAGLMGIGALIGIALDRKSKPVAMLLLIATIMLIINPLWIWDLGFQLSFLATLGLLVLAPALIERLDWMPKGIATLVAIPIAAYGWTIPIQLATFGVIPTYSILLNVLTTPLILVNSLGGMVSAAIALLVPVVGGWVAWCLQVPIIILIGLVEWWNRLPGNTITTGGINAWQVVAVYGTYGLVWWKPWLQKRWWLALLMAIALITAPIIYLQAQQQQITVLSTSHAPAIVVQDQGQMGLIFGGTDSDATYTVLPFLRTHGIRRLHWAIALDTETAETGWPRITDTLPIQTLYYQNSTQATDELLNEPATQARPEATPPAASMNLQPTWLNQATHTLAFEAGQQVQTGHHPIQFLTENPAIFRFQFSDQTWMICDRQQAEHPAPTFEPGTADVIWWSGDEIDAPWIEALKPTVAIAPSLNGDIRTHGNTPDTITTPIIEIYETDRVGALQWTPQRGFESTLTETADF